MSLASLRAQTIGMAALSMVVVPHPVGGLEAPLVEAKGAEVTDRIVELLEQESKGE